MTSSPEMLAEQYADDKSKVFYLNQHGEKKTYVSSRGQYAKEDFLAGYQAAKNEHPFHAGADVYTISDKHPRPEPTRLSVATYQVADVSKVMNSPEKPDSWISVKERLPEPNVAVLAFIVETVNDRKINDMEVVTYRSGIWLCVSTYYLQGSVTHWMPLPKPPEDK